MKRKAYEDLLIWKNKSNRKPLIVQGARQVGKTWLLEEFGKREFESVAQINFEKSTQLAGIFETDFDVERIMRSIQLITGIKPVAGETLIIFDEIQSVKRGLLSLKYLHDAAPEYHIVAAGSLLGISLHAGDSFPVGKVEFMDLYPLSFEEFMMAMGQEALLETILSGDYTLVSAFRDKYIELLKQYYYVGGMPEVVQEFALNGDFKQVRSIQNDILRSYDNDFSKHPPLDVIPRLKMVWNNIPS
ncbi:MAG: AAA family ATPase, partial [Bacteroides sp.]